MEIRQIKELMASMGRSGVKRLTIKKDGFELSLERGDNHNYRSDSLLEAQEESGIRSEGSFHHGALPLPKSKDLLPSAGIPEIAKEEVAGVFVTSPMVGTFYAAASPEDPFFIKVGDKIEKSTVVCIIEAMKVMNEIKAGVAGTVLEIMVENGQPVEFSSKLFRIG